MTLLLLLFLLSCCAVFYVPFIRLATCTRPLFSVPAAVFCTYLLLLLSQVGEARSEAEAVCSISFSHTSTLGESQWMMVGHGSGTVAVWDVKKRAARLILNITGGVCPS